MRHKTYDLVYRNGEWKDPIWDGPDFVECIPTLIGILAAGMMAALFIRVISEMV